MREICVIFLFALVINVISAAHVQIDRSNLNTTSSDIDNDESINAVEVEFLKNLTAILNESEGRGKKDPKKVIKEMLKKPQIPPVTGDPVEAVTSRIPCECKTGICSCCVGGFFFNNKGCMKIKYIPEDFAFELKMMFNERTLYKNTVSGKNPRPICITPPRFGELVEMCAKFHDIYFIGRNVHMCLDLNVSFGDYDLIDRQFNCMKFGSEGVGIVSPEEGGGHPGYPAVINAGTDAEIDAGGVDDIEDYDEIVG